MGGSDGSNTNTSLLVNVIVRVIFSFIAVFICWVPMRLLWKNRELAGTTLAVVVILLNLRDAINPLIWHDDDIEHWFRGYGWCDLQIYTVVPLQTLYAASVFCIMNNLASQVSLNRVTGLTSSEKRKKLIIQSLILFPVPLLEVILTYLVQIKRYDVSAVVGCSAAGVYYPNWIFLVFFLLPAPIFAFLAAVFASEFSFLQCVLGTMLI